MRLLLLTAFLLTCSCAFAQKKVLGVSFLKNDGTYVGIKDTPDYFRMVIEPDSGSGLYTVNDLYMDNTRKAVGKSSKVDPPVLEGQRLSFYKSGKKESLSNYKNGLLVGSQYEFYPNGKPYRQTEYADKGDIYNRYKDDYLIQANYDSLGTALVENGNGYYKGYTEGFKEIAEEGTVKNGKRNGEWKGKSKKMSITFEENYKDGELISGISTSADGKVISYSKTRTVPPEFKGGLDAFYKYLGNNIKYPDDARANNVQGRVVLEFAVERDGKVTNVKVKRPVSTTIDAEAVRVISNSPRWVPATIYGRGVRVSYNVPVSFTLGN